MKIRMTSGQRSLALPVLAAAAAAGCTTAGHSAQPERPEAPTAPASAPRLIEVIAKDLRFHPSRIIAEPGQRVILSLRNEGEQPHSIEIHLPSGEVELASPVAPNQRAELRFEAPSKPGDYLIYCPVGDHRARGMTGTLTVREPPRVGVQQVASNLTHPVAMAVAPDDSGRRFIVDQIGVIRILGPEGALAPEPFLDIRDRLVDLNEEYDERGLLGLAFHPRFADNGRFFIYYSAPLRPGAPEGWSHTNHLSELRVDPREPDRALRETERILMRIDQPQANHEGGTLAFGPEDGYLYVSLGDGGGAGDDDLGHTPEIGNGQDITKLLGSILRIDVDRGKPYAIPPDNPFVGTSGAQEIYAYGFRNPYRMSFDRGGEHRLYAGDAGQELWEEISIVEKGGNHGWRVLEGTHCFNVSEMAQPERTCAELGPFGKPLLWPLIEIPNAKQESGLGSVIVGGYVYRGRALPELAGRYVFGVWSAVQGHEPRGALLVADAAPAQESRMVPVERVVAPGPSETLGHYLLGFGEDADGELYALVAATHGPTGNTGKVLKLVPPGEGDADLTPEVPAEHGHGDGTGTGTGNGNGNGHGHSHGDGHDHGHEH